MTLFPWACGLISILPGSAYHGFATTAAAAKMESWVRRWLDTSQGLCVISGKNHIRASVLGCLLAMVSSVCAQEASRVAEGLQVFYDFRGEGPEITDRSGVGQPLNLKIGRMKAVERRDGDLIVRAGAQIRSAQPARELIRAVKRSRALTIECWITPANSKQSGPARIVTLSQNTTQRNVTLGQDGARYDVRLRTQNTSTNGLPSLASGQGSRDQDDDPCGLHA